jgi:histidinol-phosphatase (PHP family)
MWSNYHTHSKYCDGKSEFSEYIESARQNNIASLGFSSHAPVPFDCKWCMKKEDFKSYLSDIRHLKQTVHDIEIYRSLEIDFIPGIVSPFQYKDDLDYTIGSIHFVDQFADGKRWEIDGAHEIFIQGVDQIFNRNMKDAVIRYFELTREMIYSSAPTIIGHLDKIKIQNVGDKYYNETDSWYRDQVLQTLKLIDQAQLIIEVNTRGIYQKKSSTTYPSPWILEVIHERDIPITINSDAHHAKDLVSHFEETASMLYNIGFKSLTVLKQGTWQQVPFDENGFSL